ncbi:hypothetical protein Pan216_00660 [Planctomycetes bacterium Pan216]|uniref:Virus attachment protein p12 family protein n=1 Tax=Kolteria novifilia TaxID=2527975 RepID=A0A518AWX7_9BACT|nr:hypothetical protein Pan216_00660 [Planctomycetes bacterium Pan216]
MDAQNVLIGVIVFAAAYYLVQAIRKALRGEGGCCDRGCGGSSTKATLHQIGMPPTVREDRSGAESGHSLPS